MLKPRPAAAPPAVGTTDPLSGEAICTVSDVDEKSEASPTETTPGDEPFPPPGERTAARDNGGA